jgi:hypothetical protein
MNQLTDQYLSLGSQLLQQVPNPMASYVLTGPLTQPTVQLQQLLRPFPEYTGTSAVAASLTNPGAFFGNGSYQALQLKAEKRFQKGGTMLASYTFSKIIANVETVTTWLDSATASSIAVQDFNNMKGEYALSNFDTRQRFVFSYVYDLPVGKGQPFLGGVTGIADKLLSGWGINGVTTFQPGFPLALTATPNNFIFGGGLRPNVTSGCNKEISGSAQSKYLQWFNTSCFSFPAAYAYGSESRTDPQLRGPGIAN